MAKLQSTAAKKGWGIKGLDIFKPSSEKNVVWVEKYFLLSNVGIMIMEKEDSDKIEVHEHVEFKVVAVTDLTYNRDNCFEIVPILSPGTVCQTKLVLQAKSAENKNEWVKHL